MARVRGWVFTSFDTSDEAKLKIESIDYKYIVVGEEICPETDRKHLQGYIYFQNARHFNAIKTLLPYGAHIEPAKGTAIQNKKYCSKELTIIENGEIPQQGKRNDLSIIRELIEDGGNMRDCIATATSGQSIRVAKIILDYNEIERDWKPHVQWFYGPTGSGKTEEAKKQLYVEGVKYWWSAKSLKWWQRYDGHENVLIDDFRGDFCTFHELLRILDRNPYTVEQKGGSRQLLAKNIIITCPWRPEQVYRNCDEQMCQLLRRIDVIREFKLD